MRKWLARWRENRELVRSRNAQAAADMMREMRVARRARDAYAAKYPPTQFDGTSDGQ